MVYGLSSNGGKFYERRKGGEAGTECQEYSFLAGVRSAVIQYIPQDK